jgi:hypothetical protein
MFNDFHTCLLTITPRLILKRNHDGSVSKVTNITDGEGFGYWRGQEISVTESKPSLGPVQPPI